MLDLLLDALKDTVIDGLKMLPFLFIAYLILEYTEHRASDKLTHALAHSGKLGVPIGAALGLIPQCGFSVASSNLFCGRLITPGTLIAVFAATSDEALPILISVPGSGIKILWLVIFKTIFAVAAGYVFDMLFYHPHCSQPHCRHDDERDSAYSHIYHDCGCEEGGGVLLPALRHTAHIFIFLLAVMFALNVGMGLLGEDRLAKVLLSDSPFQPLVTALVGLIPNCAASVALAKLYLLGAVSFPGVVAGLFTGAGVGLVVLFRVNRPMKENFRILAFLYFAGVAAGVLSGLLSKLLSLPV